MDDIEIIAEIPRPKKWRTSSSLSTTLRRRMSPRFRKEPPKSMKEILGPQNCEFIIHPSVTPKRSQPPPRTPANEDNCYCYKDNNNENSSPLPVVMERELLDLGTHFLLLSEPADNVDFQTGGLKEAPNNLEEEEEELQEESDPNRNDNIENNQEESDPDSASKTRWVGWLKDQPDENRLRCHICGALFSAPKNKRKHVAEVHLKLPKYDCDFCRELFVRKDQLDSHMRSSHPRKVKRRRDDVQNYTRDRERRNKKQARAKQLKRFTK